MRVGCCAQPPSLEVSLVLIAGAAGLFFVGLRPAVLDNERRVPRSRRQERMAQGAPLASRSGRCLSAPPMGWPAG